MSTAIVWYRRDLRLADHPALDRARREHECVVPVFVWDPDAEGDWAPGADAAPYFRVFNPVLQGEKFDPVGRYVRRWCPELADRPRQWLHHPLAVGERCGTYPRAIVDLKGSRDRALEAIKRTRRG